MTHAPASRRACLRRIALAGAAALAAAPARARGDTIRFGQSAPLTGPAQDLGIEYQRGIRMAFDEANARGGHEGRRLELVAFDDQYEPAVALGNTRELLESAQVFGLVGYVGAECCARSLPLAARAGVPFVAPLTGAMSLRHDPSPGLFLLHPGDDTETGLIARTLATIDFRRVAILCQDDADGAAALRSLGAAMAAAGLAVATVATIVRNATSRVDPATRPIDGAVRRLLAAEPQAVVCLGAYATTAAVVRGLRARGFAGGCYATSLSSAAALGPLLGPFAAGMSITQAVPSPHELSRPVVADYRRWLAAHGGAAPEYVSLEGWIAGRLVVEALRRTTLGMPGAAARERFVLALESLAGADLGGLPLRWDGAHRQFGLPVSLTVLDPQGRPRA